LSQAFESHSPLCWF